MLRSRPIGKQFWESGVSPEGEKEGQTVWEELAGKQESKVLSLE